MLLRRSDGDNYYDTVLNQAPEKDFQATETCDRELVEKGEL